MSENEKMEFDTDTHALSDTQDADVSVEASSEAKKLAAKGIVIEASTNSTATKKLLSPKDIWFYYKWHILIALFFVTVFSVLIIQAFTKDKFDLRVLYAGPAVLSDTQRTAVADAFAQHLDVDCNGDGVKNAELFDIILMNTEEMQAMYDKGVSDYFLNPSIIKDNKETLSVNAMAGEYVIFLIDAEYYGTLHDGGVFIPLDEMGITGGTRYDECAVYLSSLDIAKFYTALNVFPADTLICVKRLSATARDEHTALWEDHKRIFKLITDFKLPEGFVPAA